MADVLTGRNYVAREGETREASTGRTRVTQRVLVIVIMLLAIALAGELVYHLVLAPRLVIDRIEIQSDLPLGDEELLTLAGLRVGVPFFSVDAAEVKANLERHPIVSEAQVETVFPDLVTISVMRRQPLAAALAETPDGTVPLVFDEEGVVFQIGLGDASELPIVSGLRFAAVDTGLQLPPLVVDFLTQLRRIKMHAPELYGLFSEYRIVQKNEYAYEVVLYPMHYPLPVRIGTSIDEDMIQYVMMMLDVLQREGRLSSLSEIDFRGGEGVLRPRSAEESSNDGSAGGRDG